jgi:KinB signaling pathway activation protein
LKSRNWVYLFLTTLFIGGASTIIAGFAVKWGDYVDLFKTFNILEILSVMLWLLGVGLIFSLISQMGFFAYLTVHRFGLGIFRSASLWNAVQLVLIAIVFLDFAFLRYTAFAVEGETFIKFSYPALIILIYSLIVAYIKKAQTNKAAFVPALFFMFVVSIIEWFPALRVDEKDWMLLMIFPLLLCNTWQLLILHRLNKS